MKVQVNVSDEMVKLIDEYAEMMGVTRSSLCAIFIGQGVMEYNMNYKKDELQIKEIKDI